jgi:hypothetical protein
VKVTTVHFAGAGPNGKKNAAAAAAERWVRAAGKMDAEFRNYLHRFIVPLIHILFDVAYCELVYCHIS